jgi:DNA-binding winged helix-turn-helix (wHTH) protein/tetratricopeptide (TPR) repeat protein
MRRPVFNFSDFVFDATTALLTYKNRESRLPEQTAKLLQLLLEKPNALVTREDIEQALWPDETFVSHDQGINVAVNRLRQILRDNPKRPQFLRTIPKRGYSFCGEVRVTADEAVIIAEPALHIGVLEEGNVTDGLDRQDEAARAAIEVSSRAYFDSVVPLERSVSAPASPRRLWVSSALAVLMLVGGAMFFWLRARDVPEPALRIGISPIRSAQMSDREAAESLRLQLADAVARLPSVQVPADAAFVSPDASDISRAAQRMSLDQLLLGSLSRQGDQYDIRFELVRAIDATHIGSFEYSGERKDFPAICDRLQRDMFRYMRLHAASLQVSKGSTNNPQAYEAYLEGNYSMLERNPESMQRAIEQFTRATRLDSDFSAAYAGMGAAYLRLSEYDTDPRNGLLQKSEESAVHALKLDPMLAQAHAVLGTAEYKHDKQFARGETDLREAIRIDPNEATYRNWLSVLLVEEGRFDEGIEQLELARDRAPFWPSVYAMEGLAGVYARREAMASKAARHYVDLLPNLPVAHNTMAWVYFDTRHYEEAINEWHQMALLQNNIERVRFEEKGLEVFRARGIRAYAELRLSAIGGKAASQVNDFSPAEWNACAGHRDQALDELERLAEVGDPFILHVGVDPIFDSFHEDPRFIQLLSRSGVTVPLSLHGVRSNVCQ